MKKYAPELTESLEGVIEEEDISIARSLLEKHGLRFRIEEV